MNTPDFHTVEKLFQQALGLNSEKERGEFLDRRCSDDPEMRKRVSSLLKAHGHAKDYLESDVVNDHFKVLTSMFSAIKEGAFDKSEIIKFLEPSTQSESMGRLGHYEVREVIGYGATGVVLGAVDTRLDRPVAIKLLASQLAIDSVARKRFMREARIAASLKHDHIVTIHDIDSSGRLPFMVMEMINGESLFELMERQGPLDVADIVQISNQISCGLAHAHGQGIIHRDIKPSNILLETLNRRVKISDFGLARASSDSSLTRTGLCAGTPLFMSPEQARGENVDARSDLFSLGCTMYAMCTGVSPFQGDSTFVVMRHVCEKKARPISELNKNIPDWLSVVIDALLEKDPANRIKSAERLETILRKCQNRLRKGKPIEFRTNGAPKNGINLKHQSLPRDIDLESEPSNDDRQTSVELTQRVDAIEDNFAVRQRVNGLPSRRRKRRQLAVINFIGIIVFGIFGLYVGSLILNQQFGIDVFKLAANSTPKTPGIEPSGPDEPDRQKPKKNPVPDNTLPEDSEFDIGTVESNGKVQSGFHYLMFASEQAGSSSYFDEVEVLDLDNKNIVYRNSFGNSDLSDYRCEFRGDRTHENPTDTTSMIQIDRGQLFIGTQAGGYDAQSVAILNHKLPNNFSISFLATRKQFGGNTDIYFCSAPNRDLVNLQINLQGSELRRVLFSPFCWGAFPSGWGQQQSDIKLENMKIDIGRPVKVEIVYLHGHLTIQLDGKKCVDAPDIGDQFREANQIKSTEEPRDTNREPDITTTLLVAQVTVVDGEFVPIKLDNPIYSTDRKSDGPKWRWSQIPKQFQNWEYSTLPRHHGKSEIQVRESGMLYLLINSDWGGGGNPGKWKDELTNKQQFIESGWREIKTEDPNRFVYSHPVRGGAYLELWHKQVQAGFKITLRTHKYVAPMIIQPIASHRLDKPAKIAVSQPGSFQPLQNDAAIFDDRKYKWTETPNKLKGARFWQNGAFQKLTTFEITEHGSVYLAVLFREDLHRLSPGQWENEINTKQDFLNDDWEEFDQIVMDADSHRRIWTVFHRQCKIGEKFWKRPKNC